MILRALVGAAFFCLFLWWVAAVALERDPCAQVDVAATPVRLVMQGARALDKNLQWVADQLTWLSWSIKADVMAQRGIAVVLHGRDLQCAKF